MAMQAVLLGFGGSGAQILTFVKELSVWKYGQVPPTLKFLLFDTIKDWKAGDTVQLAGGRYSEKLAESDETQANLDNQTEYFHLQDQKPLLNAYVRGASPLPRSMSSWLHTDWLATQSEAQLNIKDGAAQQRQIGRFAVFQNSRRIKDRIKDTLKDTGASNVWLVGSSAGGTGAGALIDAAFLARLAAEELQIQPKITGVIVLPEVYHNTQGISFGRAYSLFRELERVQEIGITAAQDGYRHENKQIVIRVPYDDAGQLAAIRSASLFDHLFFVGEQCSTDEARKEFFTSVANSIDPHLDDVAGGTLLQASVNNIGGGRLPASFGASRVYLPAQTLEALYTWEEIASFIEQVAPAVVSGNTVIDVVAGVGVQDQARKSFDDLLPFFAHLGKIRDTEVAERWAQTGAQLDPTRIVEEHLQLANPQAAGISLTADEARLVQSAYRNPFVSLVEPEERVAPERIRVKTADEARKAKVKEDASESRDRFHKELVDVTARYRRKEAVDGAFTKGSSLVLAKVAARLREKIDAQVAESLAAGPVAADRDSPTALTREYSLLAALVSDKGPVARVREIVRVMKANAQTIETSRQQELQTEQSNLKEWQPSAWWRGGSVLNSINPVQEAARTSAGEWAKAYQRLALLELLESLLDQTSSRLEQWRGVLREMLERLVLKPRPEESAYAYARGALSELETRLQRQAGGSLAVIDPISAVKGLQKGDPHLHGYRAHLKQETTLVPGTSDSLASDCAKRVQWVPQRDTTDRPGLTLQVDGISYDATSIPRFMQDLSARFRGAINNVLSNRNVFHYLQYCREVDASVTAGRIGQLLDSRAKALGAMTGNPTQSKYLVYNVPGGPNHSTFAEAMNAGVPELNQFVNHSDRFSVTLLTFKKPADLREVSDVELCRRHYIDLQVMQLQGVGEKDDALRRAEVYHIFRGELEAWFIERWAALKKGQRPDAAVPPRIVRLLDQPARMRTFVACLATGAVTYEKDAHQWWWHAPGNQKIRLNDPEEGAATVLRAAVNFVLKEREGLDSSIRLITLEDAKRSAAEAAAAKGKSEPALLMTFAEDANLESFLNEYFPDNQAPNYRQQRGGLKSVFEFYAVAGVGTDLSQRMLPA